MKTSKAREKTSREQNFESRRSLEASQVIRQWFWRIEKEKTDKKSSAQKSTYFYQRDIKLACFDILWYLQLSFFYVQYEFVCPKRIFCVKEEKPLLWQIVASSLGLRLSLSSASVVAF